MHHKLIASLTVRLPRTNTSIAVLHINTRSQFRRYATVNFDNGNFIVRLYFYQPLLILQLLTGFQNNIFLTYFNSPIPNVYWPTSQEQIIVVIFRSI